MYEVKVTTRGTSVGPIRCVDLDAAVEVLRRELVGAMRPGRRVMWVIRCPSGQLVRGDITINAASTDRSEAASEHVTEIRDILAAGDRSSKESATQDIEE